MRACLILIGSRRLGELGRDEGSVRLRGRTEQALPALAARTRGLSARASALDVGLPTSVSGPWFEANPQADEEGGRICWVPPLLRLAQRAS